MMRRLVSEFVKYPFYANILIAILIFAGSWSFISMKKSFFPERSSRFIFVNVFYPGASPKEMEEGITTRIEESVRGLVGIKEITSTSSENFSQVRIESTGQYELDEMLTEVKNAVDGISSFPSAAERPIVFKQRNSTMAAFMGVAGDTDLFTLKKYANQIEDDFLASGILSQIQVNGYPPLELSIEVSEENLLRYNITFDEISRAVIMNNADISGGMIKSDEEEMLIRLRERTVDPDIIADIILRGNNDGTYIRIRDIGEVKLQFADVAAEFKMNGTQAISINIQKLNEEDLEEISEYLNNYVEEFNATHSDATLYITYDFLDGLNSRLSLLYTNGGIGLLLVLVSLGLFLSFRLSLWVAWGIPASFLGMFIVANIYGITINMISLFGMILVVGILVDDGIVIAENIYAHFEKGKSPRQAAVDGTMEVLPAVVTSISTTVIAFSPLFFLKGRMEMLFEMAFVVVFSLIFSLIEAFFILPGHVGQAYILRSKNRAGFWPNVRRRLDRIVDYMRHNLYGRTLRFVIRWKYVMIVVPVALILITAGLFGGGLIQATFFPSIPFDQFNVDIAFKPGSGEKRTEQYIQRFDSLVWVVNDELKEKYDDPEDFIAYTFAGVGNAFNGQESGSHAGGIFVLMRDMEGAPISSFQIASAVRKKIGEIPEAEKFTVGGQNRFGYPVSVSLLGKDLNELKMAKEFLIRELESFESLQNINDNNAIGKQEVKLKLKPKAYFLGLNRASITQQIRQGFFGDQAQRLQSGKDELRVWVRYPNSDRLTLGQLENVKIKTQFGQYPLSELVDYEIERGPVSIQRFNLQREIRINSDLLDPYEPVPPILERIRTDILPEMEVKYPGVSTKFQGQQRDSAESAAEMQKYFGVAFLLMILLIMLHFKSFAKALIIILMIPLAWIGAAWGHGIENTPVSMLSAWGMVALSGVIINDAVVFLSKYNRFLLEGQKVKDAVFNAGIARFRPIVLTTITTVLGLYPIIFEKSFQAQFLKPMAISLAYGVLVGTAFILILFPVIILVLNDIKIYSRYIIKQLIYFYKYDVKRIKLSDEEKKELDRIPSREEVEEAIIYSKQKIQ